VNCMQKCSWKPDGKRPHEVGVGVGVDASALRRWMDELPSGGVTVVLLCSARLSDGSTRVKHFCA